MQRQAVLFDLGWTLVVPRSGDWMLTPLFEQTFPAWREAISPTEMERAQQRPAAYLAENHRLTTLTQEVAQITRWYELLGEALPALGMTHAKAAALAEDHTYNVAGNYTLLPGVREMLESLARQGYARGVISDTWPSGELQPPAYGIDHLLDARTFSFALGAFKPHASLYRDALRVQLPEQPAAEGSIQRPALSREEAAAELARTQTLLAQERTRFDTLTGRIRALDRSSDLEAQLAQKQEQLTALQDEYDAIALAMDALSQANTVLQNRFSPALGARAAEIFSAITGGRYDRVLLSRDFSLSAEPAGDPVGRSVRLLSQGAADQLYLAVRLAICDMVLPADKRVPLILDDALVTFDDERLHAALDYLLEESQRRQILLFTCQKREMAYLQGKENVTVTKL